MMCASQPDTNNGGSSFERSRAAVPAVQTVGHAPVSRIVTEDRGCPSLTGPMSDEEVRQTITSLRWISALRTVLLLLLAALALSFILPSRRASAQDWQGMADSFAQRMGQVGSSLSAQAASLGLPADLDASTFLGHVQGMVRESNARDLTAMGREAAILTLKVEELKIGFLQKTFCASPASSQYAGAIDLGCQLLDIHSRMNVLKRRAVDMLLPAQ